MQMKNEFVPSVLLPSMAAQSGAVFVTDHLAVTFIQNLGFVR